MIPIDSLIVFFSASALLALSPGPDNIFVLTQSALRGAFAGFIITLGLCTGLLVHTSAVAFGVAAIFKTSALAFNVLKYIGAVYLLYMAWKAFRASPADISSGKNIERSMPVLYRRGIIMNITNPKVSIFFLAFLPQFADPSRGPLILQIFLLGLVFILAAIIVFGMVCILAGTIGDKLRRSPRTQNIINRIAGLVLVGLALKLATSER
ncbi:MAG: LysE family translocator [Deltaproteobacteria bacterium]|nr:LysE family translocator [Deltaproteobacteria bacterium]